MVRAVALDVGGGLVGEHHLKELDSLRGKVAKQLRREESPRSLADALAGVRDGIRYTIVLDEDRYAVGAAAVITDLLDRGLRPVAQTPELGWRRGLRRAEHRLAAWADGTRLRGAGAHAGEPTSKTVSHPLYEQTREMAPGPAKDAKLAEHDAYFVDVPVPAGAADIALPDPVPHRGPVPVEPDPSRSRPATSPQWSDPRRAVTDAEAVELARRHVVDTAAGLAFYPVEDDMRDFAMAVRPAAGYLTLDLHGSAVGFQIDHGLLTPRQFAAALRDLRDVGLFALPAGVGIKLISCDTAFGGETSPAAILARELGVEVIAPDQPIWTSVDGFEIVSSPTLVNGVLVPSIPPDGSWHRFSPTGSELAIEQTSPVAGSERPPGRAPGGVPSGPGPPDRPDHPPSMAESD